MSSLSFPEIFFLSCGVAREVVWSALVAEVLREARAELVGVAEEEKWPSGGLGGESLNEVAGGTILERTAWDMSDSAGANRRGLTTRASEETF